MRNLKSGLQNLAVEPPLISLGKPHATGGLAPLRILRQGAALISLLGLTAAVIMGCGTSEPAGSPPAQATAKVPAPAESKAPAPNSLHAQLLASDDVPDPDEPDETPADFAKLAPGKKAGDTWNGNGLGMAFCWCPDGTFRMGSPTTEADREDDEGPVEVTLTGFWAGKLEVTQAQWQKVMATSVADQQKKYDQGLLKGVGPKRPMYYVTDQDAADFCARLTESERKAQRLPDGWQFDLPTEAQWEYACRAGSTGRFAAGDDAAALEKTCWFLTNSRRTTNKVGTKEPNAWGLHDMQGNVKEWCRDWYAEQLPGGHDPEQAEETGRRACRGGSFESLDSLCRSAARTGYLEPGQRAYYLGFRVVLVRTTK